MKYKVTLKGRTYEVEVEAGEAILLDEYEAIAPSAPAAAPAAAAPAAAPAPVDPDLEKRILSEAGMEAPMDCRVEDSKRTGEEFANAKAALGDLAETEEDVMSYICFPAQAEKFLEGRRAKEENKVTYTITEA